MIDILIQLAPIFVFFGVGIILKSTGIAERSHGEFILRLVLMVTLPLLILSTCTPSALVGHNHLIA